MVIIMKIFSVDQSSTLSGYCLFDGKIIEKGIIDKHDIKESDIRIGEMSSAICAKIEEYKPDMVVIEGIQSQGSIATVILLARLQGMILGYCYAHGIETKILAPSKWRSQLSFRQGSGVKRDALKQQAVDYIAKKFGINDVPIDMGEAICIAVAADKMFDEI